MTIVQCSLFFPAPRLRGLASFYYERNALRGVIYCANLQVTVTADVSDATQRSEWVRAARAAILSRFETCRLTDVPWEIPIGR